MQLDVIPVIGEIGPMPDLLDAPFWEGLRGGELRIQRCAACATWIWGPQWTCPACLRAEPRWQAVEVAGRVYSWTRTWHAFATEFADHLPYVTVLVELPQAGARRLLGLLADDAAVDPIIGEPLVGVVQQPSELTSAMPVLRWKRT